MTLPNFSQIGDVPQTPPLDLLDPIRKPLLSAAAVAVFCSGAAAAVKLEILPLPAHGQGRGERTQGGDTSKWLNLVECLGINIRGRSW